MRGSPVLQLVVCRIIRRALRCPPLCRSLLLIHSRRRALQLSDRPPLSVTSEPGVRVAVTAVPGDGSAGLRDGRGLGVSTLVAIGPGSSQRRHQTGTLSWPLALPRRGPPAMPRGSATRVRVVFVRRLMMMMIVVMMGIELSVLIDHLTRPPGAA